MTTNSGADAERARKLLQWMALIGFLAGLGIAAWATINHDWRYVIVGVALVMNALMIGRVLTKARAAKDADYARRLKETRIKLRENSKSEARVHLISAGVAAVVVTSAMLFRKFAPGFSALPKDDQRLYLMLGAGVVIVLGNLAWMAWKKQRVSPRP